MDDPLVIGGKEFSSRLMVGTGRHRSASVGIGRTSGRAEFDSISS